jgi:phage FluMu gp28-like protein
VELRRIPFDCQALIRDFILDNVPLFHHAKFDARGNGQSHAEGALQRYGAARVECVMAHPAVVRREHAAVQGGARGEDAHLPAGEDVIADHRRGVLDKGKPKIDDGRDKGSDGEWRHGDYLVACLMSDAAFAWKASRRTGSRSRPTCSAFRSGRGRSAGV